MDSLLRYHVFRVGDFNQWGADVMDVAIRVTDYARLRGTINWLPDDPFFVHRVGGASTPQLLRERSGILSHPFCVATDLKDSGFQLPELNRLGSSVPSISDWPLFVRARSEVSMSRGTCGAFRGLRNCRFWVRLTALRNAHLLGYPFSTHAHATGVRVALTV